MEPSANHAQLDVLNVTKTVAHHARRNTIFITRSATHSVKMDSLEIVILTFVTNVTQHVKLALAQETTNVLFVMMTSTYKETSVS